MNYKNHTQEELEANFIAAADSADYAYADAACACADAAYAAEAAYFSTDDTAFSRIDYWVNKYFEITGEDKALYEAEIKRINGAK